MVVIAKTENEYLVTASANEIKEILKSVGNEPSEVKIGQKIPAYDYAKVVKDSKNYKDSYEFGQIEQQHKQLGKIIEKINNLE